MKPAEQAEGAPSSAIRNPTEVKGYSMILGVLTPPSPEGCGRQMVLTFPKTRRAKLEGPATVDMSHTSPLLSGSSMATRDWHKCQHGAGQGVGRPSGWTPSNPGHRREPQQQFRARQTVPIMNFYFQDPSSLPSGELPSSFYGRYVYVSPPPSKTKQDSGDMGWGWHWCLRVVDMDVCRDGTDEPNQFPT